MLPTVSQVHVNQPLTNISIAYMQSQSKYIADMVFPIIPSDNQSDLYYVYSKHDFYRDEMQNRAPGTSAARAGYNLSTSPYSCVLDALSRPIPDEEVANEDMILDAKSDSTRFLTQKALIKREKRWVENNFQTGIWTGSSTGTDVVPGTKWDNAAGDPVKDVGEEIDAVEENTGFEPNIFVCPKIVYRALQNNEDIKDRLKYTGVPSNSSITPQMLASLFGVEKVLVAGSTNNVAVEKTTDTGTMQYIFNADRAGLFYAPSNPGRMTPSAGYTFTWRGLTGNDVGVRIKDFRDENTSSDIVQIDQSYDQKVVASDLGMLFDDVLT